MTTLRYPTEKLPIGPGDVFWSDEGRQIRVFGETTSLRGPTSIMDKVAMRIIHLVDGHGGYGYEADGVCQRCEELRSLRRRPA